MFLEVLRRQSLISTPTAREQKGPDSVKIDCACAAAVMTSYKADNTLQLFIFRKNELKLCIENELTLGFSLSFSL